MGVRVLYLRLLIEPDAASRAAWPDYVFMAIFKCPKLLAINSGHKESKAGVKERGDLRISPQVFGLKYPVFGLKYPVFGLKYRCVKYHCVASKVKHSQATLAAESDQNYHPGVEVIF